MDPQSRRCVVGNAQRPDRPVAPVDNARQEPFAGIGVRTGSGSGRETAPTLARQSSAWSVRPATSAGHVGRSPSRSAMPLVPTADPATTTRTTPQRTGRRAPKRQGRRRSPTGRSALRGRPPRRSHRPNPSVRRRCRIRVDAWMRITSSQRHVAAGGGHLGRTATGHVDTGVAGRRDLVSRWLLKRARHRGVGRCCSTVDSSCQPTWSRRRHPKHLSRSGSSR